MNNIETAIKGLEFLRTLEDNWNSYGATAPTDKVIDTAISFVKLLEGKITCPINTCPFQDGAIEVNWIEETCEIDVDFYTDSVEATVYFVGEGAGYEEHNWNENYNIEHILPMIDSMRERL